MKMKENDNLQLTPDGERFKNYLTDMLNGEQYRVALFEDNIKELGDKMGLERMDMIKAFLEVMEEL
ncbi:Uncharacterised protein [Chlamydia trachomatis]|nr:Uncharacterised protein [Chlamydia trachomatis]